MIEADRILSKDYVIIRKPDDGHNKRMGQVRVIVNGRALVQFVQTERIWYTLAELEKWR